MGASVFTNRDLDASYSESDSIAIVLNGNSISCNSGNVSISGSTVTISKEGTYVLSGTLEDGSIIVDTDKSEKVQLVLNGVSMHSQTTAPIYVRQADKVFITLADGTENSLTNGGSLYVNASGDGLDSNGTLTISGGYTVVCGPTQGDTATLDYESSGVITVSAGSCAVGTAITLTDGKGNTIISYSPGVSFSVVILSSPEIIKGQPYTITVGSASGSFEAA